VTGEWRNLHIEELPDFYSSPSTIGMIKSRRIRSGRACSTKSVKKTGMHIGYW
jgi:hypothetical protein